MKLATLFEELLLELNGNEIYQKYYSDIPWTLFFGIVKRDPQTVVSGDNIVKLGKFSKLLINLYKSDNLKIEDLPKAEEYLGYVYKYRIPVTTESIKSLSDLYNLIRQYIVKDKRDLPTILHTLPENEYKLLHDGNDWYVFQPLTERASCQIGVNSEWCTTWGKHSLNTSHKGRESHFGKYNNQGPLYIIINKNDSEDKYQFHFESEQYMNRDDRSINPNGLLSTSPELKQFFFPSLYNKNLPENIVDSQYERINILKDDDVRLFISNTIGDENLDNPIINVILDRKNDILAQMFVDEYGDEVKDVNLEFDGNYIHFEYKKIRGNIMDVKDVLTMYENDSRNAGETLRNDIYNSFNEGDDDHWGEVCNILLRQYYDGNQKTVRGSLGIYDYENFHKLYFNEFLVTDSIQSAYIDEYVNKNTANYEGIFDKQIKSIEKYVKFYTSYGYHGGNEILLNKAYFILFLVKNEINDLKSFTTFDDMMDSYVSNYGLQTDYEGEYFTDAVDPTYSDTDILNAVDNFFNDIVDNNEEYDCEEKKRTFDMIYTKVFKNKPVFENEHVYLKLNTMIVDCAKDTVNVTFKNKDTGKTYTGEVKVKNLSNYVYNHQLFEQMITFKRNI